MAKSSSQTNKKIPVIVIPDSPPPPPKRSLPASTSTSSSSFGSSSFSKRKKPKTVVQLEARWPAGFEYGENHRPHEARKEEALVGKREEGASWSSRGGRASQEEDEKGTVWEAMVASTSASVSTLKSYPTASSSSAFITAPPPLPPAILPNHPLLNRISRSPKEVRRSSSQLWTTNYGPQSAEEVLGEVSGKSAAVLKEWLEELTLWEDTELPTKKRRHVIRMVDKKKRKKRKTSYEDDWIVSDGESQEDYSSNDDEDDDETHPTSSSAPSSPSSAAFIPRGSSSRKKLFPILSNLFLLCGPTGSGKTSTVHAVANELGWEVFEVYPGLGKRMARDVERYVGDVSKNHLVHGTSGAGGSPKKLDPFAAFRKKAGVKEKEETFGGGEEKKGKKTNSLILFEEVDILYAEEKDFWSGLISLVEHSKRPVIMTCTDTSTIPFPDLALQTVLLPPSTEPSFILPFAPPPPSLVIPYLQLIACSEGRSLSTSFLSNLFNKECLTGFEQPILSGDKILHPLMAERAAMPDLRKSIMQLQFVCQREVEEGVSGEDGEEKKERKEELDKLEAEVVGTDALSFADAFVARRLDVQIELEESLYTDPGSSVLLGVTVLPQFPTNRFREQLAMYGREDEFVESIEELASGVLGRKVEMKLVQDEINEKRRQAILIADQLTERLVDPPNPILPNPSIFVEYLPLIRQMTAADVLRAVAENGEEDEPLIGGGMRRSTRLNKYKFVPKLQWEGDEARLVRESGFPEVD